MHECSDSVSAHHYSHHAVIMEIIRVQILNFILKKTKKTVISHLLNDSVKYGIAIAILRTFRLHFVNLNYHTM